MEEVKKYHHKRGLTKDTKQLGMFYDWGWKGTVLFGNIETGKFTEYKISEIEDRVEIISKAVYDCLYDERNVREGEDGSREKTYGKIHDTALKIYFKGTSINGYWSKKFMAEYGVLVANIALREELVKEFGHSNVKKINKKEENKEKVQELAMKYHFPSGGLGSKCLYMETFERVQQEEVTEEEIQKTIKKHFEMDDKWHFKDESYESEEMKFYIEQAKTYQ